MGNHKWWCIFRSVAYETSCIETFEKWKTCKRTGKVHRMIIIKLKLIFHMESSGIWRLLDWIQEFQWIARRDFRVSIANLQGRLQVFLCSTYLLLYRWVRLFLWWDCSPIPLLSIWCLQVRLIFHPKLVSSILDLIIEIIGYHYRCPSILWLC